jgi:hypothetical protein
VADIFISYATDDRPEAARLAAFLEEQGYSVWWDRELSAGQQFYEKLAQALADCRVAIVLWTSSSVKSRWVLGEAETAASAEKLVPVRTDSLTERQIPLGFRALHTIPRSDRAGLLRAIKEHFEAAPKAMSRWGIFKMRFARRLLTARERLTLANVAIATVIIVLGGYFFMALIDWMSIQDSAEPSDFQRHLATFPFSPFASRAQSKLKGVEEWEAVKGSRSIGDLQEYTQKYPDSVYYQFARLRLTRLQALASQKYKPVLADSSRRPLKPEEINALDCARLWTARNEIFYSLGYCFVSDAAIDAFGTRSECPYNNCKIIEKFNSLTQDIISKTENDNINAISRREQEQGCRVSPVVGACARKP